MNFVTYGYIVLAAMHVLRMTDKDEKPNVGHMNESQRKEHIEEIASKIVRRFITLDVKMPDNIEARTKNDRIKKTGRIRCGYNGCVKTFVADNVVRRRHREICQFKTCDIATGSLDEEIFEEEDTEGILPSEDSLYNYSCRILTEGLLDLARQDAVREGDGERI